MTPNDILVDSSFLFSLYHVATEKHNEVVKSLQQIRGDLIIPIVVLTEVAYLFRRVGGIPATTQFLSAFTATQPNLQSVGSSDLVRVKDVMNAYPSAELDFVDCCLVAISEQLNITKIATLDRRDFEVIRPKHCNYFELIP